MELHFYISRYVIDPIPSSLHWPIQDIGRFLRSLLSMKAFQFRQIFDWKLFLMVWSMINEHCYKKWNAGNMAENHFLMTKTYIAWRLFSMFISVMHVSQRKCNVTMNFWNRKFAILPKTEHVLTPDALSLLDGLQEWCLNTWATVAVSTPCPTHTPGVEYHRSILTLFNS